MARYVLQQKLISIGDDFYIKNQDGRDLYFVDGYGFSFGNKLSFQDMQKKELLLIKQKLFAFTTTYNFTRNRRVVAKLKRSMFAFRDVFYLTFAGTGKKVKIVGRMVEHEYKFYDGRDLVAEVTKKWFRASDTYSVDIQGKLDHVVLLAAAVAIDLTCHDKDSKHNR